MAKVALNAYARVGFDSSLSFHSQHSPGGTQLPSRPGPGQELSIRQHHHTLQEEYYRVHNTMYWLLSISQSSCWFICVGDSLWTFVPRLPFHDISLLVRVLRQEDASKWEQDNLPILITHPQSTIHKGKGNNNFFDAPWRQMITAPPASAPSVRGCLLQRPVAQQ